MTRILLTYSNACERKLAARRASRLSARGVDVDLATAAAAATLPAAVYDRVLDASSCEPLPPAQSGREGIVYIASAGIERVPVSRPPAPARAPARVTDVVVALFVGGMAAVVLGLLALPLFYPVGVGFLVTLATLAVLQDRHPSAPAAHTPTGATPLARCG